MIHSVYLCIFLFISVTNDVNCEWFSSLGQMEDLVYEELDLLSSLRKYIQAEETKIQSIKRLANQYQQVSENAQSNIDQYLGHPVNQYRLVKRLASEWSEIESLVMEDVTSVFLSSLSLKREHFPNEGDIKGSSQALMRLQNMYMLDTHEIAQGVVKGIQANQSLTPGDCFYIGRTAFLEKKFYQCALWMSEVLQMNEQQYVSFSKFDVLDHLAYCVAQLGNIQRAFAITVEMLQINPSHSRILANYDLYRTFLGERQKQDNEENVVLSSDAFKKETSYLKREKYESLCRQEQNAVPPKVGKRLKCYYWTNNNHPRLILQPVKLEEMWDSPHLVRFYDVITDLEINVIKSIAKPHLNRATVQNPFTGLLEYASYRVSKSAWLADNASSIVAKVCQKISDITGLSMTTAEPLQIANYGMGGHYEPHYDFSKKSDAGNWDEKIGNRIATFLIYLSDVGYGGNTVFLNPGVAVRPIKGSAAFWYNLFPSGAGDLRTWHAACPVLTGVKWVSNKWIHERDQEFRRKCRLKRKADNRLF